MNTNNYFVKDEARLKLEILECSDSTRRALERQARRQHFASVHDYITDLVLACLESDEEQTPSEDLEQTASEDL